MENTLEGINNRVTEAEERISELEDSVVEVTATEQNKEKKFLNEDSLREIWDNIKCANIHIKGVLEGEEKEKGLEKVFEDIIVENFVNMRKETLTQVQEVQRIPYRMIHRKHHSQ